MEYILLLCVGIHPIATIIASKLPSWHMKPIGSHIKPSIVDETFANDIITPRVFANEYVLPRKPLVFRNVVRKWPAFRLWTDEYLKEKYGDMELRLEAKKERHAHIPKGDVCLGRDRLRTFLNEYQSGVDKYVISELPTPMWGDVLVPSMMGCGDFLKNFVEIDMWINSEVGGGGSSILHKDAFNTINCVINGTKDWKLFALKYNDYIYQSWEGPSQAGYGGFSLVNPDKVDAREFPNFGLIPEWQLTTIKAGDCLYLPSQMWHQVTSYGTSNKAVAFLFNRFESGRDIDTTNCPESVPTVRLSEVDVDLQYPGHGMMTMGDNEIEHTHKRFEKYLVDEKKGYVTRRKVFRMVLEGQRFMVKFKEISVNKTKEMYAYLLSIAGGDKHNMTVDFVRNLTRDQVRNTYQWIFKEEPSNSYNYEYSWLSPEQILNSIHSLQEDNRGTIEKDQFIDIYQDMGGTLKFAQDFWKKLAGDKEVVTDISATIKDAIAPYEYYRQDDGESDDDGDDGEKRITTPQGHQSQPKSRKEAFNEYYNEEGDGDRGDVGDGSRGDDDTTRFDAVNDVENAAPDSNAEKDPKEEL